MKKLQTLIAVLLGASCLAMAVVTVRTSRANVAKQVLLQQQQAMLQNEVRSLQSTDQMSRNVLTDLGNAAMKNEAIKALLAKHGYSLQTNAPPAGTEALPVVTEQKVPVLAPMDLKAVEPKIETPAPKTEVVTPPVSAPVEPVVKEVLKEEKP